MLYVYGMLYILCLLFKSGGGGGGGGGVAVIDMVYQMNTQFTRRKIIILSKSKILVFKYLVFIKLHYY